MVLCFGGCFSLVNASQYCGQLECMCDYVDDSKELCCCAPLIRCRRGKTQGLVFFSVRVHRWDRQRGDCGSAASTGWGGKVCLLSLQGRVS